MDIKLYKQAITTPKIRAVTQAAPFSISVASWPASMVSAIRPFGVGGTIMMSTVVGQDHLPTLCMKISAQALNNMLGNMKKILFNCTSNIVGGGVKNSAIFISYAIFEKRCDFYFAISPSVKKILDKWGIDSSGMHIFEASPARNMKQRKEIKSLADRLSVDCVFTMAGPAYVKFNQKHYMGLSNPYITHADLLSFKFANSWLSALRKMMLVLYQAHHSRFADYFIFQTEVSRLGFCKRFFVNNNKTSVIPNSIDGGFSASFMDRNTHHRAQGKEEKTVIFCPAAGYSHKAVHLIPKIALAAKSLLPNEFIFVLTVNQESWFYRKIEDEARHLGVEENVTTVGAYNYADAAPLYAGSDIVFVPSILETFSASYLEAFASKKPLIAADREFARDICGDAAVYVDVKDSLKAAKKIAYVLNDRRLRNELIERGVDQLKKFGDQRSRYEKILHLILSQCN